jgi:hypothetical protein
MESIRKDPDKYSSIIYYNNASSITGYSIEPTYDSAYAYGYQLQYPSYDSFFEAYKTMLLDDAEKVYKTLVTEWVNRIIAGYISPNSSSTSSLLPSGKQEQSKRS